MATKRAKRASAAKRPQRTSAASLLVGTRKGLFLLAGDSGRKTWRISPPHFLGHIVHHAVLDPRDRRTLLVAARAGHLGPTVFRSTDRGRTWKEASRPPRFPRRPRARRGLRRRPRVLAHAGPRDGTGRVVRGHLAAGALPLRGRRRHLGRRRRAQRQPERTAVDRRAAGRDARRRHAALDPRRPARSAAPVRRDVGRRRLRVDRRRRALAAAEPGRCDRLHARPDAGVRTRPALPAARTRRRRTALPAEPLRHLPHRSAGASAGRGSARRCRRRVGDIGFPMVVHPRDPDTAWVFPMDGTTVWPRTSPGGKPAVYGTRTAARAGSSCDSGLPREATPGGR